MISTLTSPSVCVVDDEEVDFRPILAALNALYISCVHIKGDDLGELPAQPFSGVRLVFQDLHLTADTGKTAASHAANVFRRLVSTNTSPVVVVIWSKYADDVVQVADLPPEDQKTEAQLFRETLEQAEPDFCGRLIYLEMPKPRLQDRPEQEIWVGELKKKISETLQGKESIEALWQWESLVHQAAVGICEEITSQAYKATQPGGGTLEQGLKTAMQLLARAQSEGDLSAETAPRHLTSALAQLLVDQLEYMGPGDGVLRHGPWLTEDMADPASAALKPKLNALLLTGAFPAERAPFLPGAVYMVTDNAQFEATFGASAANLARCCFQGKAPQQASWEQGVKPVVIEISPTCDVAQTCRNNALLLAGLIFPSSLFENARNKDAWVRLPIFALRWSKLGFGEQNVSLVFCSRYHATLPVTAIPPWLDPWFRLRDLPTSALRNWHAGSASRIGYVVL